MSFSGDIKEELSAIYAKGRHCQIAELASMVGMCGKVEKEEIGSVHFHLVTENFSVARKSFTLAQKTFNINTEISIQVSVRKASQKSNLSYVISGIGAGLKAIKNPAIQAVCCKRAYIRGAFLAAGSMSDPSKSYHFEIVCDTIEKAQYVQSLINSFSMDAKIVLRKKNFVVYLKEGAQIVDVLNVMGAHASLLKLENVRVLKDMRNAVNRKVNCETANINKTVSAAVKQMEDIGYIKDTIGFDNLPEGLKDVALTRLQYPEAALKELGTLLETPTGKSGVNHRLRKLSEMAERLREQ